MPLYLVLIMASVLSNAEEIKAPYFVYSLRHSHSRRIALPLFHVPNSINVSFLQSLTTM